MREKYKLRSNKYKPRSTKAKRKQILKKYLIDFIQLGEMLEVTQIHSVANHNQLVAAMVESLAVKLQAKEYQLTWSDKI